MDARIPTDPTVTFDAATPAAAFAVADWVILGIYLTLIAASGAVVNRFRPRTSSEYFVGDRAHGAGMPTWAVALSVLATTLSAATFIGAPVESYNGDLTYLSTNLGSVVALVVIAFVFLPAFYRHSVTTVYQVLEVRLGVGARRAASAAFMLGRILASGARLYMAAVPLTMILTSSTDPPVAAIAGAIAILSLISVLYCLVGGIKAIIWTDVVQVVVFIGAAVAAVVVLLNRIPADLPAITQTLADTTNEATGRSKLAVIVTGGPVSQPYTLLTALFGFSLLMTAALGTDQDLAQRMLTCKSAVKGSRSAVTAILVGLPVTALFCVIGLLLYVFYQEPAVMGGAAPGYLPVRPDDVFTTFILREMPAGLKGLMMAGLFAISLTSLMSALNAMASTLVVDFYRPLRPGRDEGHYLFVSRAAVALWGVVLGGFAALCILWQRSSGESLIQFALGVMSFAYSGLLAVFFTALLTRRGNTASAVAAIVTGVAVTALLQPGITLRIEALHGLKVAFPWRLLIATAAATAVCLAGSRRDAGAPR